jgi:hypothetical protein
MTPLRCRRSARTLATALFLLAVILGLRLDLARAQAVRSHEEAARILTIDKLTVQDGKVTGEVNNRASHTVRDVQLLVRYTWLWDDERHPGKVDPGTSAYHSLQQEILPGGTAQFTFLPSPPLPTIAGGHYETSVSVAGFTEVLPQTK